MAEPGLLRSALRSTTEFDVAGIDVARGIRCAAGVTAVLAIGIGTGRPLDGSAAAVGALSSGFASFQGVYRSRLVTVILAGSAMAVASFAAAVLHRWAAADVVLLALFALGAGQLVALGQAASLIGLQAVVAVIVLGQATLPASVAGERALWVLGGAFVQGALVMLWWPVRRYSAEREALAAVYRSLAAYAARLPHGPFLLPEPSTLPAAAAALADPQPFAAARRMFVFRSLLEEGERIRSGLVALGGDRQRLAVFGDPRIEAIDEALQRIAAELGDVADRMLVSGGAGPGGAAAPLSVSGSAGTGVAEKSGLTSVAGRLRPAPEAPPASAADLAAADAARLIAAIAGQLRAAARIQRVPASAETTDDVFPAVHRPSLADSFRSRWSTLRANASLQSASFRHALRMAVTLAVADVLSHSTGIAHGYWIPLTVAIVLRPDFTSTLTRGFARTVGTVVGAVVATAVAAALEPSGWVDVAAVGVAAVAAYSLLRASYAIYTVCLTSIVAFLLAPAGAPTATTVEQRAVATLIGGALSLLAYWLWPTWSASQVPRLLARYARALRGYAGAVLGAWAGEGVERSRIRAAQLAARQARSNAEAAVEQLLSEPPGHGGMDAGTATTVSDALHRFGLSLVAFDARLDTPDRVEIPEVAPLARTLGEELDGLASALEEPDGRLTGTLSHPSRELSDALAGSLSAAPIDPVISETVRELSDALVDSLGTAAHALDL